MKDKYFLDTNVLVYCFLSAEREKHARSMDLVDDALNKNAGLISYQVVQEFLNLAVNKFVGQFRPQDLRIVLEKAIYPLCDIMPSMELYQEALELKAETGYHFYDSLILASAIEAQCGVLYSEDFQADQNVRGLRIVNPFRS